MAGPKLIRNIEVKSANVGKREPGIFQELKHLKLDVASKEVGIGSAWLKRAAFRQPHGCNGWRKDLPVNLVKIYVFASDLFFAERHDHKADLRVIHGVTRHMSSVLSGERLLSHAICVAAIIATTRTVPLKLPDQPQLQNIRLSSAAATPLSGSQY